MRKPISLCLAMTMVAVMATTLVAQGPPPGAPAGPPGPKNLKVLPKTWNGRQVGALMQTFTESLGVQCSYCHAEDPNAPPPAPGQNPRLDYSLDTKKEKDVARDMIKMVMSINDSTKSLGDAATPQPEKVSCFTCHRGDKKPAFTPPNGWGRGNFSLSDAGPVVPQRGGPGGPGGPGAPPPGGAPPAGGR